MRLMCGLGQVPCFVGQVASASCQMVLLTRLLQSVKMCVIDSISPGHCVQSALCSWSGMVFQNSPT